MYALADEPREWLLDLYRQIVGPGRRQRSRWAWKPRRVPWWPEERRDTTLGWVLIHMLEETAHHAGQADVVRESIDGRGGADHDEIGDEGHWQVYVERVQAEADQHRP